MLSPTGLHSYPPWPISPNGPAERMIRILRPLRFLIQPAGLAASLALVLSAACHSADGSPPPSVDPQPTQAAVETPAAEPTASTTAQEPAAEEKPVAVQAPSVTGVPATAGTDHLALGKMWTFENPPLAYLEAEYGFKPDQKWLDSLRLGALRLGERENPWCSASFVSPQGLIMTNHHCIRDNVATLGQERGDAGLVDTGYAAKALEDELPLTDLTVQQLVRQQDVTATVNAGITDDMAAVDIARKRAAAIEQIESQASEKEPELMHQVVTLYQGAVHQLYSYKVYDDIRLVLAVNLQAAHFGGDPDNFTYPRWSIDFSFVRAYENGAPADTKSHYFRWRQHGAQDDELVFVPGNPGNTNRLMTTAQLEYQRDVEYPITVQQLLRGLAILNPFAERIPQLKPTVLGWENSRKAFRGMLDGLLDENLMQLKRDHEAAFRAAVDADPAAKAEFGGAWDAMQKLAQEKRELHPKLVFHTSSYLPVLDRGLAMMQAVDPDLDEEDRAEAASQATTMEMRENPLTQMLLTDHFLRATQWLGGDDTYLRAMADGQDPASCDWAEAFDRLRKSALGDAESVQALIDGGADAIAASDDPGVQVIRVLYPLKKANEAAAERIDSAIEVQGTLLGRALFAVYGNKVSPDATMTLRFSDGLVQGYEYNGTLAPWSTSFYGLFGRAEEFGNEFPFDLAEPIAEARDAIDKTKRVCFVSTNDIVGGNSGSCVVDKDLNVVGLIFDGNIESLPNDFYYTQKVARAVSVHTDAIVECLDKVYDMGRVLQELRDGAAVGR
jgi:hypothetical protein